MNEQEQAGQQNELARLRYIVELLVREPYSIENSDLETTLWKIRLLTAAAQYFNVRAFEEVGGHSGDDRGVELLQQVVAAPFQTFDGEEIHPDPFDKAAMLLRGIAQGHPFGDGNKRAGILTACYFLELVGHPIPEEFRVEDIEEFVVGVSAGRIRDVGRIAAFLRLYWKWERPELDD